MTAPLLLKNVVHNKQTSDILIENGVFSRIDNCIAPPDGCRTVDCRGNLAISPAFYNTHTHAAMTLLRGYADDMELFNWLQNFIWSIEAKLTPHDIYIGSKLAMLEMIRSGTVFFNDMYWYPMETIKATQEMKMRAAVGMLFLSGSDPELEAKNNAVNAELEAGRKNIEADGRICLTLAPHAIYSVSREKLAFAADKARRENYYLHIHLAETRTEKEDCLKKYNMTPAEYLHSIDFLTDRTLLAHSLYLERSDMELIKRQGAHISYIPCSNMKLGSGSFHYQEVVEEFGCDITIGTDGAASNNNLSMFEEMKFAALGAKRQAHNPEVANAVDIFRAATRHGAEAFGINGGVIEVGKVADCLLIDLDNPFMVPDYNFTANMVYSADSSCIDSVICGGDILMLHKFIDGEKEILQAARECCRRLNK